MIAKELLLEIFGIYSNGKLVGILTENKVTPTQYRLLRATFKGSFDNAFHNIHLTPDAKLTYSITLNQEYYNALLNEIPSK